MKYVGVLLIVLAAAAGLYLVFVRKEDGPGCPPARNPNKFPAGWENNNVPHGDLNRIAEAYAAPVIGGDNQFNGSLVGGFFKGIDVYPSSSAAQYYRVWLEEFLGSNNALPYWNIEQGELLCS